MKLGPLHLVLPVSTGMNQLITIRHGKWGAEKYKKHRDNLMGLVWSEIMQAGWSKRLPWPLRLQGVRTAANTKEAPGMTKMELTRYSDRTLDKINLVGGCKTLVDVLVRLGAIYDDSPKWLEDTYRQERSSKAEARTEVVLTWNH